MYFQVLYYKEKIATNVCILLINVLTLIYVKKVYIRFGYKKNTNALFYVI